MLLMQDAIMTIGSKLGASAAGIQLIPNSRSIGHVSDSIIFDIGSPFSPSLGKRHDGSFSLHDQDLCDSLPGHSGSGQAGLEQCRGSPGEGSK